MISSVGSLMCFNPTVKNIIFYGLMGMFLFYASKNPEISPTFFKNSISETV